MLSPLEPIGGTVPETNIFCFDISQKSAIKVPNFFLHFWHNRLKSWAAKFYSLLAMMNFFLFFRVGGALVEPYAAKKRKKRGKR